jgi:hypothetical protein
MKKNTTTMLLICLVTLGLALTGCGSSGSSDSPTALSQSSSAKSLVYGIASFGTTTSGYVSAMDSSVPAQEKIVAINNGSYYSVDVSGLKPPYILRASSTDNSGTVQMYSVSITGGRTNINPISDTAVAAAVSGTNPDDLFMRPDPDMYRSTADNFASVINSLRTMLAPLLALYQAPGDPITDDNVDDNIRLQAMFRDVQFVVASGTVTVMNKQTGGVIFSGSLNSIDSGTFQPQNMPAAPGSNSTACTYMYNPWGACQSDSTQTRTVATSSPSGCTGTPALSQSCMSSSTLTLAQVTASCTQCHGLTVNGVVLAPGGHTVSGRTASAWVSAITGMGAALAPGTTLQDYGNFLAGLSSTPASACTSFTYSGWGTCQSDSTQTRTVVTSSPASCTGGTPVLSQSCTYVPPVNACTSFTYSGWGTCTNGTQTRTVATSSPTGCTGGTPALSQSCTSSSTLTLTQVQSTCTQCHGLTVNTTVLKSGGYSVSGRSASAWVSAVTGMGATLAPGTTLQDYGNFLTALP